MRRSVKKSRAAADSAPLLFDLGEVELPPQSVLELMAKIVWSHSRAGKLEQCPRYYYFRYYGSKKALADKKPKQALLSRLKQLQNRHQRAGKILHQVIATYLRKAQAGDVWSTERLMDWARVLFRADVEYSRSDPQGINPPEGRYPPTLLHEFYYRMADAEELCARAEERMLSALRNFATHHAYEHLRWAGSQAGALVEHPFSKLKNFPCLVKGQIDLLYRKVPAIDIVDWKIGAAVADGDDSLQLAAYALWACEYYGCGPETVTISKANLGSGDLTPYRATNEVLANARARILQDAERMAAVDSYGQRGISEAFTPCAQANVCRLCPFLGACEEGRRSINEGSKQ
jgi:hypothetical protein